MIWKILRKDWTLLWPAFLAVAATQFVPAIIRLKLGLFGENPTLEYLIYPAIAVAVMGTIFLANSIVHQDAIPGVHQDWLVRPVSRRDLLLAKMLFVFLLMQGAVFAADLFQVLGSGFTVLQSLSAAFAHTVYLTLIVTIPAVALAAITRNMTEAIVTATVAFCGGFGVEIIAILWHGGQAYLLQINGSGTAWIPRYIAQMIALTGAGAVLGIQYFQRKTGAARWVVAAAVLLFVMAQFLPWRVVFALQQRFSADPAADKSISLLFDPAMGSFQRPAGTITSGDETSGRLVDRERKFSIFLPLRVTGLPIDTVLQVDEAKIRFIKSGGSVLYTNTGKAWDVRRERQNNVQTTTYQELGIPDMLYARLKNQPTQVEVDYSLTLFRLASSYGVPALGGDQRASGLGWCRTRLNESETAVELRCIQAGNSSSCRSVFLENASTGVRNPVLFACAPHYSPFFERANRDPVSKFGANLVFRDPAGLARISHK